MSDCMLRQIKIASLHCFGTSNSKNLAMFRHAGLTCIPYKLQIVPCKLSNAS